MTFRCMLHRLDRLFPVDKMPSTGERRARARLRTLKAEAAELVKGADRLTPAEAMARFRRLTTVESELRRLQEQLRTPAELEREASQAEAQEHDLEESSTEELAALDRARLYGPRSQSTPRDVLADRATEEASFGELTALCIHILRED